jgi:hypothetical protein
MDRIVSIWRPKRGRVALSSMGVAGVESVGSSHDLATKRRRHSIPVPHDAGIDGVGAFLRTHPVHLCSGHDLALSGHKQQISRRIDRPRESGSGDGLQSTANMRIIDIARGSSCGKCTR